MVISFRGVWMMEYGADYALSRSFLDVSLRILSLQTVLSESYDS
jgi:hypothetical protein